MSRIFSLFVLGIALVGRARAAAAAEISTNKTEVGRSLYVAKCAKCHPFYEPAKYSDGEWQKWMGKMGRKARLKPEQEQAVLRYIQENLRRPKTAAASEASKGTAVQRPATIKASRSERP